eukprot:TRINITY_DN3470_c0_g2_i13.p1 TRINITY_DN3470_c0_g2~~TRINITY_DN3470_c0_g2_i13.p1  ORF type:complete len:124 (-),score=11.17 TRINITY_DN3470_c0_g2_i13:1531-1902(-)
MSTTMPLTYRLKRKQWYQRRVLFFFFFFFFIMLINIILLTNAFLSTEAITPDVLNFKSESALFLSSPRIYLIIIFLKINNQVHKAYNHTPTILNLPNLRSLGQVFLWAFQKLPSTARCEYQVG